MLRAGSDTFKLSLTPEGELLRADVPCGPVWCRAGPCHFQDGWGYCPGPAYNASMSGAKSLMTMARLTFSDGVSGKWALDQYGRLMLDTGKKGYQPPAADVQAFQRELSRQLQQHGF